MKHFLLVTTCIMSVLMQANAEHKFSLTIQYQFSFPVDSVWLEVRDIMPDAQTSILLPVKMQRKELVFEGTMLHPVSNLLFKCISGKQIYYKYFVLDSGSHYLKATNTNRMLKFPGYRSISDQLFQQEAYIGSHIVNFSTALEKTLDLIKKYPENYYSLVLLNNVSNQQFRISIDSMLSVWKLLDSDLQQSAMGIWLKHKLTAANSLLKGHIFPDLTLLTASDDVFETSSMKGRSYLVIVGATWCGGCKENLKLIKPMLSAINEDSLKVLHITVQSKKLDWEKMINTYKLKAWTNVLDTATKPGDKILHQFGISFIPFYLIVDSRGIIQFNAYQEKDVSLIKLKSHLLTMRKESAFIEPPL